MNIINKKDLLKYLQENPSVSFSIDGFEENFAVCENRLTEHMVFINKDLISQDAKTGDILIIKDDTLIIDMEETKKEQDVIKTLANQLFKRKS